MADYFRLILNKKYLGHPDFVTYRLYEGAKILCESSTPVFHVPCSADLSAIRIRGIFIERPAVDVSFQVQESCPHCKGSGFVDKGKSKSIAKQD